MLHRSKSRGNPLAIDSMAAQANKNRADKRAAIIAVMTCDVVLSCVKEGLRNAIITIRGKPKTKYQYNQERKRDFRVGKSPNKVKTKYEMMSEEQESGTKIVYAMLESDPSMFIRDYKAPVFEDMIRLIHPSFPSFTTLERIDLSHQRIGDERCQQLCKSITRSPVVYINLAGNELTDIGIRHFATIQRSLHHLTCLNLSWNLFTDDGFVLICDCQKYHSATLTQLDLTYNSLSPLSAYHLGALFEPTIHCNLQHIRMGGVVSRGNKTNCDDDFLKQFLAPILKSTQLKRLQVLHLADAALTDIGVELIFSWLLCDECNAMELNISKTYFSLRMKALLPCVLSLSPAKDCNLMMIDCGLTVAEIQSMQAIISNEEKHAKYKQFVTTRQVLDTIRITQQALNNCLVARYYFTQQLLNTWKLEAPVCWMDVPLPVVGSVSLPSARTGARHGGQTPSSSSIIKYIVDKRELQEKVVLTMLRKLQEHAGYVHMLQQVLSVMERQPKPDLPRSTSSMTENLASLVQQMMFVHEQIEELTQWHSTHLRRWILTVDDAMIKGRDFLINLYPEANDNNTASTKSFLPSIISGSSKKTTKKKTVLTEDDKMTEETLLFLLEEAWMRTQQQGESDCRWIGLQYKLRLLHFIFIQISSSSAMPASKGGYLSSTKSNTHAMKKQLSSFYSQASSSSVLAMQQLKEKEKEKEESVDYRMLLRKMVPCAESGGDLGYFMYYLCTIYSKEKDSTEKNV